MTGQSHWHYIGFAVQGKGLDTGKLPRVWILKSAIRPPLQSTERKLWVTVDSMPQKFAM